MAGPPDDARTAPAAMCDATPARTASGGAMARCRPFGCTISTKSRRRDGGARGLPAAAAARRLELRRGRLDVGAAPAAAGQRAGLVTSADDGQQTRERTPAPVDGQRDAEDLTPARSSDAGEEER
ncbi:hypothetical protein Scep_025793 [Stephania cephalantha]|uniref:Uncharacterized protein n=1 Tax=Stephania cephalantha TaxID=152367 RepID=A0AAP0EJC5_9MAGN